MKKGFTLAEVLITLGIIGVVAALAAPGLNSAVQKSKVGPSLAKFKSTMENGFERMLADEDSDSITAISTSRGTILKNLSNYVKMSETKFYNGIYDFDGKSEIHAGTAVATGVGAVSSYYVNHEPYTTSDGMSCWFVFQASSPDKYINNNAVAGSVMVDINGEAKPNRLGKDVFGFFIQENGTLIPSGTSKQFCKSGATGTLDCASYDKNNWKDGTLNKCDSNGVTGAAGSTGMNCTASIFENGLKVIYKY